MKRDGMLKSIWQDVVSVYQPLNQWQPDDVYDVLIVGAGITGLTTALLLQSQGKKCILAEAHSIGFGTSGGTTAHLNTILDTTYPEIESSFGKDEAKLVADGAKEAIQLIKEISTTHHIDCDFEYKTAYLFAQNEKEEKQLSDIVEAGLRAGVEMEWTDRIPSPVPFLKACAIQQQAQFNIVAYLMGLAKAFEQAGGIILQDCLVDLPDKKNYIIPTSLGDIKAVQTVFATHIPPSVNILHFRCAPYRSYAAAITLNDENYPDGLVYDMEEPYHYFRTHTFNNKSYLIAGGFDHKTGHQENSAATVRELEAYLKKHYDVKSIDFVWSSQYYIPTDGLPYIGKLPGWDRVYTGTGFNGNGMIFGTLSGKIISDMILGKENRYESLYSPSRIKPLAGFVSFVEENVDVAKQFISKRFSYEQIDELVKLSNDEARLVEYKGKRMALYKDGNGQLHALDPVCPHAGCIVVWNNAEKTWDCPCHGARYAIDGSLLNGPSIKGLSKVAIYQTS